MNQKGAIKPFLEKFNLFCMLVDLRQKHIKKTNYHPLSKYRVSHKTRPTLFSLISRLSDHLQGVPKKRGIKNFNFLTQYLGLQTVLRKVIVLKIKL